MNKNTECAQCQKSPAVGRYHNWCCGWYGTTQTLSLCADCVGELSEVHDLSLWRKVA